MIGRGLRAPIKFTFVGIANTLTGLFSIYLCKGPLGFGDVIANACGYSIGLALSFILNRGWTFRHSGPLLPAFVRFLVVFILAYLSNLATVLVAINLLEVNSYLAQASGVVPYSVIVFFGSRHFAFGPATAKVN